MRADNLVKNRSPVRENIFILKFFADSTSVIGMLSVETNAAAIHPRSAVAAADQSVKQRPDG
jgi:hypothetical protein